uniref:Telomerase Cajal body protein 1-like n=1 Tax=Nicotiana tabacum TaxID=4097 RepID=A0A1S4AEW3_TOBAC|nr:PREDICTED: uncharacterized protein LOC107796711 [Nicotiana tabacum]
MENAKSLAPNKEVNNEKMGYFFKFRRCGKYSASAEMPPAACFHFCAFPSASAVSLLRRDNRICDEVSLKTGCLSFAILAQAFIKGERLWPYVESGWLADTSSSAADTDSYAASLVMSEGESVYDYCRYPYMSSSSPETCVFASTARDHPIHLWDATTGQLRCTYRAYDAMDEIIAAFSIAFNPAGTKIFAGYNKSIRIFDIHRPGRDFTQHSTLQGNKEGQSGIISSIAFCPSIQDCWLQAPIAKALPYIEKITWNFSMYCMVKKVG